VLCAVVAAFSQWHITTGIYVVAMSADRVGTVMTYNYEADCI